MICERMLRRRHALMVADGALSQRASNSDYWFESYVDFAEWVSFAYWWSFIGKALRLQPEQQVCLLKSCLGLLASKAQVKFIFLYG